MYVDEAISSFEIYLLSERGLARNTVASYLSDLKQLATFLNRNKINQLESLLPDSLKDYLKYLKTKEKLGARSVSRKISTLKSFFKYLSRRYGMIDETLNLVFPKLREQLPKFLSEPEVEQLLKFAARDQTMIGLRNYTMLILLYATGIRVSELVELKIQALRFDDSMISIQGKGDKQRLVPVSNEVIKIIQDCYIKDVLPKLTMGNYTDYLFPTIHKDEISHLTRQSFWLALKKMAKTAGIEKPLSPHVLRHSLATHLLKKGANLRLLQVLLGHERLATVQIYTHVDVSYLRSIYDDKHNRS